MLTYDIREDMFGPAVTVAVDGIATKYKAVKAFDSKAIAYAWLKKTAREQVIACIKGMTAQRNYLLGTMETPKQNIYGKACTTLDNALYALEAKTDLYEFCDFIQGHLFEPLEKMIPGKQSRYYDNTVLKVETIKAFCEKVLTKNSQNRQKQA